MTRYPSVICPIDFSDASRASLAHAATIADHFGAEVTVLAVADPFVAALAASESPHTAFDVEMDQALRRFCDEALAGLPQGARTVRLRQAVGTPAEEILREACDAHADLIVMSSRRRQGFRKTFFGSTTERVLRHTPVPVLITPAARTQAVALPQLAGQIHEVVAPIDLTTASSRQVTVAAAIAEAMAVPLMVMHVLAPIAWPLASRWTVPGATARRLEEAQHQLSAIHASVTARVQTESLVLSGEPADEIVKTAESRQANLIVMGLHSAGMLGPRMGSVTYRVLCMTDAFVLALPPHVAASIPNAVLHRATA